MQTLEINEAFWIDLTALDVSNMISLRPDQVFPEAKQTNGQSVRKGVVSLDAPEFLAFGDGRYTRINGVYQIDLRVPQEIDFSYKTLKQISDEHKDWFFPSNAQGKTLMRGTTSIHIEDHPFQQEMGRAGSYIRDIIEVPFYVDVTAA